jgi:DNA-binding NarL/FixJ family response regulator
MTHMIRLVVADDHPVVRDGLITILGTQPDFQIVGKAGTGQEALEVISECHPDVLLLDLEMPEMDGVETLRRLKVQKSPVRTLVFTAFDTDERIVNAVQAGAQGYLLKGAPREDIFHAIRVIHAGGSLLQPVVASKLMRQMSQPKPDPHILLTTREQHVLELLAKGLQNKEIGQQLHITERTVKFYVSAILSKFAVGNRTEAVRAAVQRGLITL